MIAAKASLAEAKEKLRQAVLAQPAILHNAIEQTKTTRPACKAHCKTSKGLPSPSIAQQSEAGASAASRNRPCAIRECYSSNKRDEPKQRCEGECGQCDRAFAASAITC